MSLTPDQLAVRQGRLGASEVAAAIGVHPYRSPLALWAELTGRCVAPSPSGLGEAATWGTILEPLLRSRLEARLCEGNPSWHRATVAELAEETYRGRVLACDEAGQQVTIGHATYDWLLATPDDLYLGADQAPVAGAEVKNRGARQAPRWGETGTDLIPDETLVQATVGMACAGLERWYVAAYFGGYDFRVYAVAYDAELMSRITECAWDFLHRYVRPGVMPPVTSGDDSTHATLAALFPRAGEVVATVTTADELAAVDAYVEARSQRLAADAAEADAAARVKQAIGDRAGLRAPDGTVVRWLSVTSGPRVDYAGVAQTLVRNFAVPLPQYAEICATYSVQPPAYRRLHVRETTPKSPAQGETPT